MIVRIDYSALKYLLQRKEAKPKFIGWVLLQQEFDLEIRDKNGSENVVADHWSRLINKENKANCQFKRAFQMSNIFR